MLLKLLEGNYKWLKKEKKIKLQFNQLNLLIEEMEEDEEEKEQWHPGLTGDQREYICRSHVSQKPREGNQSLGR